MSVAYILNNTYSYVENSKLNPALEVGTSIKAPVHYVQDLTLSKNESGSMVIDAPVVEATVIQCDSANVISGVFTSNVNPLVDTTDILVNGNLDFGNISQILNLNALSTTNGFGTTDQVLSVNSENVLYWKNDAASDVSQWSTFDAVSSVVIPNTFSLKCSLLTTSTPEESQINVATNMNLGPNTLYCESLRCNNNVIAGTAQFGVEPNRWTGVDSYTLVQQDGSNTVSSISGADLVGFHDHEAHRGKFFTTDADLNQLFSADSTGAIISESVSTKNLIIPGSTPTNGQVLKTADGAIYWDSDLNVPSAWSEYAATQTVNMDGNAINNVGDITSSVSGVISGFASVSAPIFTGPSFKINVARELHLDNHRLVVSSDSVNPPTDYWDGGALLRASAISVDGYLEVRNSSPQSVISVVPTANRLTSATGANISGFGDIQCATLNPTFKAPNDFWVAPNGRGGATGSIENPFSTVQAAINASEAIVDNVYRYIHILGGDYSSETLTISKKVYLVGEATSASNAGVGCSVGAININVTSNGSDMFNNQVSISNLFITGVITHTSTNSDILNLQNCYIYAPNTISGRALNFTGDATDYRLWIADCQFLSEGNQGLDPFVEITKGMARITRSTFESKGNQSTLVFSSTGRADSITYSSFTSNSTSATAPAVVAITSAAVSAFVFSSCAFIYSSATNKAASPNSCGILCNSTVAYTIPIVSYCTFALAGTTSANFAIQDANTGTPRHMYCFYYSNCATLSASFQQQGHEIRGNNNTDKFTLSPVI